jgi:hypothetical protein
MREVRHVTDLGRWAPLLRGVGRWGGVGCGLYLRRRKSKEPRRGHVREQVAVTLLSPMTPSLLTWNIATFCVSPAPM